jgi:hypothetical protein
MVVEELLAMRVRTGLIWIAAIAAAIPNLAQTAPLSTKSDMPIEKRCALVSTILNFSVDSNTIPLAEDECARTSASWRGKLLVELSLTTGDQNLFSAGDICATFWPHTNGAAAADFPRSFVNVELTPTGAEAYLWRYWIGDAKIPKVLPCASDEGQIELQAGHWKITPHGGSVSTMKATSFRAKAVPPMIMNIPVRDRCALVSKIINFRIEIQQKAFRFSLVEDSAARRLAYWHRRPLVCAFLKTRNKNDEFRIFSEEETCGADFVVDNAETGGAPDSPEACIDISLKKNGVDSFHFSATIGMIKFQSHLPPGYGTGIGFAPVEGTAKRNGNGWVLKQLFKPARSSD